jgi:hypothetical protein
MAASQHAAEFIRMCLETRTAAHMLHLQAKSFAVHEALGGFYAGLSDLIDTLAETYQGQYGVIERYPEKVPPKIDDPVKLVTAFIKWVAENRNDCATDSHIQNIIDEIVALANRTRYKLVNLK